ncbi:hypothetical protein O7634_22615 [Micromonospora sp. WMMD1120]|uniref:hypothetical protein n=1 Tax=Micromonospora sp. WMMD1120 TaxID=3016106 RepID=UPI002415FBF9|nr:hypothetical protein [Micromonospora sp. WMMD1120]MDG4809551.1 hypothetical protein [Micromonospora sp. WMMD1120]
MVDRIAEPWGERTPYGPGQEWPVRVDRYLADVHDRCRHRPLGARDEDLLTVVRRCEGETALQLRWLRTRMKAAAPQALVVAD